MRPTLAPLSANAQARLAATVDLPTPPLPLLMAMTCLTPGIRASFSWDCWGEACSSAMTVLLPLLCIISDGRGERKWAIDLGGIPREGPIPTTRYDPAGEGW